MHDESWRSSNLSINLRQTLITLGGLNNERNNGRPHGLATPPMPDHAVP
jgi:hypothetical protein